jgi:hypothetical protein
MAKVNHAFCKLSIGFEGLPVFKGLAQDLMSTFFYLLPLLVVAIRFIYARLTDKNSAYIVVRGYNSLQKTLCTPYNAPNNLPFI